MAAKFFQNCGKVFSKMATEKILQNGSPFELESLLVDGRATDNPARVDIYREKIQHVEKSKLFFFSI